ncbi:ATP synthase F0 subunit C [symbiont of Argiope bruennichi]|uniref:ATP synthase F0 subunit C n=1 Tax=symbiont of Argiope bruennichi TaxID=2810479 RepID=UPI003DA267C5
MHLFSYFDHTFSVILTLFYQANITDRGLIAIGAGMAATGCLGAGIGQGFSAGKAAEAIGRNPDAANKVRTIMIIGAAIAESGAIYSLLISLILMFVYS